MTNTSLKSMTLRVARLAALAELLTRNPVSFARPTEDSIRVDACGAALIFIERPPG